MNKLKKFFSEMDFKGFFSKIDLKKLIPKAKKSDEEKGENQEEQREEVIIASTRLRGNKSISTSLIFSISLTIVGFTLILGLITYQISRNSIINTSDEFLLNKAIDSAAIVDARIDQFGLALEPLGNLELLGSPNISWNEKVQLLRTEKSRLKLSGIGIADTKGNLILDDNVNVDVSDFEFFKESNGGKSYFAKPFYREESGKMDIGMSIPLWYNKRLVGSIIAFQNADSFYKIVEDISVGETGYAYILDENIDIVSHPTVTSGATMGTDGEQVHNPINFKGLLGNLPVSSTESLNNIIAGMESGQSGIGTYKDHNTTIHLGYAQVPSKGWTVVVNVDEKEVLQDLNTLKVTMVIILIISLIASIIIPYSISRKIVKGIIDMSNRTKTLSDFNLTFIMDENILNRNDEIGTMGRSIQTLIDSLKDFAHNVQSASQSVAASSEELAAITEESLASSTSVADSAGDIAERSQLQLQEIQGVSAAIADVSNEFSRVLNETKLVDNLGNNAFKSTELGKEVIDEVIEQMASIKVGTVKVKESLENINSSSTEMDQILIVIQGIAEQTNLLALNAAIEAARAGEAGRGFAVVADEIRKLADQTKSSTDEIGNILRNNNTLIIDANTNMELSNSEVDKGINKVNETKATFDDIARIIGQVTVGMANSTESIMNVEASINSAVNSATNAENITIEVADQIHNVSAATEEQMASMDEVTSSTESLARLADELQELIQHIRL